MKRWAALILEAQRGQAQAKEILFRENEGLIHSVVKRFMGRGVDREDLFQIGCVGFLKAIARFDLRYHTKFSTYAVPVIVGEIKGFLRDEGALKVSRRLKNLSARIQRLRGKILCERGEEPTIGELAGILQVEKEEVTQAMDIPLVVESLEETAGGDGEDRGGKWERLGDGGREAKRAFDRAFLSELLGQLQRQERRLLYLRYFQEKTQQETGRLLGLSQVQVSRLEKAIFQRLQSR